MKTAAIVLAAGQGTRMRSKLPKVLHHCAGVPLVAHAVERAIERKCSPIVVVIDPQGKRVRELLTAQFSDAPLQFAVQKKPRGTGDATKAGLEAVPKGVKRALILYGDVPLLRKATVAKLAKAQPPGGVSFLSAVITDPAGYGRVVREKKHPIRIVEHRDASRDERAIDEINAGVYCVDVPLLRRVLSGLTNKNAQGEFYLTDIVAAAAKGPGARAVVVRDPDEILGVNTRKELATAERILRKRIVEGLMDKGVTFLDPDSTFVDASVRIERDVTIGVGIQLWGRTKIASGAYVEGPSVLRDATVGRDSRVLPFCHLEGVTLGKGCTVGPFSRLRLNAQLDDGAETGNFVEVKKSRFGAGAKAKHLAYIGDATLGKKTNIGAGTITCNYDGANKHPTELGAEVFIGSNSTLVAPVKVGSGAYVAAGSTITKPVPKDALSFGRSRQTNRAGYAKMLRAKQARENAAKKGKR